MWCDDVCNWIQSRTNDSYPFFAFLVDSISHFHHFSLLELRGGMVGHARHWRRSFDLTIFELASQKNEETRENDENSQHSSPTLLVSFISRSINCIIAGCSLKQFSSLERALSSSRWLPLFTSFAFHSTRLPTHIEFFLSFFILYLIPISFRSCPNDIYVNFTQEHILFDIWKWQKKSLLLCLPCDVCINFRYDLRTVCVCMAFSTIFTNGFLVTTSVWRDTHREMEGKVLHLLVGIFLFSFSVRSRCHTSPSHILVKHDKIEVRKMFAKLFSSWISFWGCRSTRRSEKMGWATERAAKSPKERSRWLLRKLSWMAFDEDSTVVRAERCCCWRKWAMYTHRKEKEEKKSIARRRRGEQQSWRGAAAVVAVECDVFKWEMEEKEKERKKDDSTCSESTPWEWLSLI